MNKIAECALAWIGKDYRAGVPEQCMNFVRQVLKEAGHPLADQVTSQPVDGHWTGISLASSLAGRDLGPILIRPADLQAGDICFWQDTYPTGFPPGTITHVGIHVGDGQIVHRPTKAAPVRQQSFESYAPSLFRCALRPRSDAKSVAVEQKWVDLDSLEIVAKYQGKSVKVAGHSGKLRLLL